MIDTLVSLSNGRSMDATRDYWTYLASLLKEHGFEIDRPKGSAHPRYPERIYPIDYGFIPGTASSDGQGIDLFHGTAQNGEIAGIICTLDDVKKDSEIKVLPLPSLANVLARLASCAPFRYIIFLNCECPDIFLWPNPPLSNLVLHFATTRLASARGS